MVKKGITEMEIMFSLRFRCHFFRHIKLCDFAGFEKKIFFELGIKGLMEKCVSCFLVYLF